METIKVKDKDGNIHQVTMVDKKKSKAQREKEKAELIQELGYDPDQDPMQDHWDHESDKIAIQKEFHDNETS